MQVEALLILNLNQDILFYSHCLNDSIDWNDYVDRLVKLLPPIDNNLPPFLIFDNIVVGTLLTGSLRIILTAPTTSNFILDNLMKSAVSQINKILTHICKDDISQSTLMKRDNYICLKLLLQAEISTQGYMHFITDLDEYANF